MAEYVITTENAADLPESFVKENEIGVLSLYYTIDGVTYGPGHCLLYTSPSPRDRQKSRMPSSA